MLYMLFALARTNRGLNEIHGIIKLQKIFENNLEKKQQKNKKVVIPLNWFRSKNQ